VHRTSVAAKFLGAITFLLFSCAAAAGNVTGTVASVLVRASDGLTFIYMNGSASGQPACATNPYWIILNETSDAGHKQYAMLLDALATGAQVTIFGNGTCTRWGDGEDINVIQIL
jgi:hypothetical protein